MKKELKKKYLLSALVCVAVVTGIIYYYFFEGFSTKDKTEYVCIDNNDNIDSVYSKLSPLASKHGMCAFRTLARHMQYADKIRTGRYAITPGDGAFSVFRHMRNGQQAPVSLTIPSVRTMDKLAGEISKRLLMDSTTLYRALTDEATCQKLGYDTATIACLFIPNTYDVYWNIPVDKFLEKMQKENNRFWNPTRCQKASQLGLTHNEVITLASIVDEETANNSEKPMIAGMYYNRLKLRNAEYPKGMPLQADPTTPTKTLGSLPSLSAFLPSRVLMLCSIASITTISTCAPRRISAAPTTSPKPTRNTWTMPLNMQRHSTNAA